MPPVACHGRLSGPKYALGDGDIEDHSGEVGTLDPSVVSDCYYQLCLFHHHMQLSLTPSCWDKQQGWPDHTLEKASSLHAHTVLHMHVIIWSVSQRPQGGATAGAVNEEMTLESSGFLLGPMRELRCDPQGSLHSTVVPQTALCLSCVMEKKLDWRMHSHRFHSYIPLRRPLSTSTTLSGGGFVWLFLNGPDPPSLSSSARVAGCGDCDRGEASGTKVTLPLFSIHPLLPAA